MEATDEATAAGTDEILAEVTHRILVDAMMKFFLI